MLISKCNFTRVPVKKFSCLCLQKMGEVIMIIEVCCMFSTFYMKFLCHNSKTLNTYHKCSLLSLTDLSFAKSLRFAKILSKKHRGPIYPLVPHPALSPQFPLVASWIS